MVERLINKTPTSTRAFRDIYPFESRFIPINGHVMHYIDEGQGPPVLMVHGNPTWSFYFRHLITGLTPDFRAIAPDHIGCGLSDKPDAQTYAYTLESRVRDLDAFIRHLDLTEKIHLVVHDWGGMIGLAWAVNHPDRIGRIIITNTSGFFLPRDKSFPFLLWVTKYIRPFAVPAVLGANAFARGALLLAAKTRLAPEARKGLMEPYNSWKNRIAVLKFVQDIPITGKDQSHAMVDHVDRHLHLLNSDDMLLLWGAKDFVFDLRFLDEFRRRFPRAMTRVFHEAGHYLFEDRPEETARLIRGFLSR